MMNVYLPPDKCIGVARPNLRLAADYLELKSFAAAAKVAYSQDIIDALEVALDEDFPNWSDELTGGKNIEAVEAGCHQAKLNNGATCCKTRNPFILKDSGASVHFLSEFTFGRACYLVALLLSNLRTVSPLLARSQHHPTADEVAALRQYFQFFATAAMAAEVVGPAWSFGFPRPDGNRFSCQAKRSVDSHK